jgi:hypothetical protein
LNILTQKLKEVLTSVLPIVILTLVLGFTIAPLPAVSVLRFAAGALFVIAGLTIFLVGVEIGVYHTGQHVGAALSRTNKTIILVTVGAAVGFFISAAEPDLHILASEISDVTGGGLPKNLIVAVVSAGIGGFLSLGLIRIVYNLPLFKILIGMYGVILLIAVFAPPAFLAIAFDAAGATTGAITVPFALALSLGISSLKKDSKASEKDSFGLVGIMSAGAVISTLLMSLFLRKHEIVGAIPEAGSFEGSIFTPFLSGTRTYAVDAVYAIAPLFVITALFQIFSLKLPKRQFVRILKGLLYSFIGYTLFATGVSAGFMGVGREIGESVARLGNFAVIASGFALGVMTILAEPAVHVLTMQIESVTSGYIIRKITLLALSIGVGLAVALAVLRIVTPSVRLWMYLLPGYTISIALNFIIPKLFVGIAFDAGGVATGPITVTFVLAFTHGVASVAGGDAIDAAFGMISIVALIPVITMQILGLIFKISYKETGGDKIA